MSRAEIVDDELVPVEENPVLQGNFAPVDEELVVQDLPVEGAIPAQLNGSLFRDGPNPIAPGPGHHWFLGDGMVHSSPSATALPKAIATDGSAPSRWRS